MSAVEVEIASKNRQADASKTLLYISLALTSLCVLCNVALLGLVAYIYSDMQNKYDTAFFIFGEPNSSIADMLNDKLRMNYRPVFEALSNALEKVADALESSRTENIVKAGYLFRTLASMSSMLAHLEGVQNNEGQPKGTPAMSTGMLGNMLGVGEGENMPLAEFFQAQGDTSAISSLGTTCKSLAADLQLKRWSYTHVFGREYDDDYADTCDSVGGFDNLEYRCVDTEDLTSDVQDMMGDIYDWCLELERTAR